MKGEQRTILVWHPNIVIEKNLLGRIVEFVIGLELENTANNQSIH